MGLQNPPVQINRDTSSQPMEEPQQPQAEAAVQVMGPDLTSVMGWALLKEITRHMDTAGRSSWRLVSKAARQAVYDSTTALAPCSDDSTAAATALLPWLVAKCSGLKQLSCRRLPGLSRIAAGLLQLTLGLEALDISSTDVRDLSFIARCTSLRRLAAQHVPACRGRKSRQLAAVLQQLPGLTALDLHDHLLGVDAARDVAVVLHSLTALEELVIGGDGSNRFVWAARREAAAVLLPAVPQLHALRILDLSFCYLGDQALPLALLPLTRLQQLRITCNCLDTDGALLLASALRQMPQLEHLDLSRNIMGDEGVSALAPAIQQLTRLTALLLGDNSFSRAGAQALAPALRHLTRLRELELYSNDLEPAGIALLAPALQQLTGLQSLDLGYIGLGPGSAATLARVLQSLTMLQHLDLSYNDPGPAGLQALLPAIQQLSTLRSLDLGSFDLDGEGALLFAAGIHQLPNLQQLLLAENELDAECQQAVSDVVHAYIPGCKVRFD